MARLLTVANRLPTRVVKTRNALRFHGSPGGLASGLGSVYKGDESLWIGWPGIEADRLDEDDRRQILERLKEEQCLPVFLSKQDVDDFYLGFSNQTLWPLCHYFLQYVVCDPHLWEAYQRVNQDFCDVVARHARPGDTIWVHDYQLFLLPRLLREHLPDNPIGFFLHIPFPDFEVFRYIPWARQLVEGLLGADLIGFHTDEYTLNFLDTVRHLTGLEHRLGRVYVGERMVQAATFPMGIDYDRFALAANTEEVQRELQRVPSELQHQTLILSVDRLDYSKGIPQRLEAFDRFLEKHPEYQGHVTLVLVAVPSRSVLPHYQSLKRQVDTLISDINGKYSTLDWAPIWYMYRGLPFPALAALYYSADVAMVTPIRDGMNLIAKEYVATKAERPGVLILSETAGAAKELDDALLVHPLDIEGMADTLHQAIVMSPDQQAARNRQMQQHLQAHSINQWSRSFVETLLSVRQEQPASPLQLEAEIRTEVTQAYRRAGRRLLLLDYDGTLAAIADYPHQAEPDQVLLHLLQRLGSETGTTVVLVSGRDRDTVDAWFGRLPVDLVAEHGAWGRRAGGAWEALVSGDVPWKPHARETMEAFVTHTPGSFIEEKSLSMVWHYRKSDAGLARLRSLELKEKLAEQLGPWPVQVLQGHKIIEARHAELNKGHAAAHWLQEATWDFILAAGDDATDEDLFAALPGTAIAIKVGDGVTVARYRAASPNDLRALLNQF